jgi:hypothetical protein
MIKKNSKENKVERILNLTLKKLPFDVMITGEKRIEYRASSKWIISRLEGKNYDLIKFVNGYGNDKPYFFSKYEGWEIEMIDNVVNYSNGLIVESKKGTIKIKLGEIIEKGNLK